MSRPIRPAAPGELDAVLALWRDEAAEPGVPDSPESLHALLGRDDRSLLVAVEGDVIVGAIIAGWDGWRGSIYRLAVRASRRRGGLGLALVREAERTLRARGARRIQALVYANDERARAFWSAAGYALDERLVRYVHDVGDSSVG